jgi:HEPN domain-containing protein
MDKLAVIDSIYTESRYPGETGLMPHGKPTPEDAREMYEFASSVYLQIVQFLEKQ